MLQYLFGFRKTITIIITLIIGIIIGLLGSQYVKKEELSNDLKQQYGNVIDSSSLFRNYSTGSNHSISVQ